MADVVISMAIDGSGAEHGARVVKRSLEEVSDAAGALTHQLAAINPAAALEAMMAHSASASDAIVKAQRDLERNQELHSRAFQQPFKNASRGIQGAFSDAFEKIFSGGVRSFSDLGATIKRVFIRLASEIATLLVFRPVVGGLLGSVGLGGVARDLGMSSPASGGGAGGSGLSFLSNALGFANTGRDIATGQGLFGGLFGGGGAAASGGVLGLSPGFLTSQLHGDIVFTGAFGTATSSAAPTAAAGIGGLGALGLAGLAIGGGLLLSRVLGRRRASVGPNGGATIGLGRGAGAPFLIGGAGDNGFDWTQMIAPNIEVGQQYADILGQLGGRARGGSFAISSLQGRFPWWTHEMAAGTGPTAGSFEEAGFGVIRNLLRFSTEGLAPNIQSAINRSTAATLQKFLEDIDFAKGLTDLAAGIGQVGTEAARTTEAARKAAVALGDQFGPMLERATRLGLEPTARGAILGQLNQIVASAANINDELSQTARMLAQVQGGFAGLRELMERFGGDVGTVDAALARATAQLRTGFGQGIEDQILGLADPAGLARREERRRYDQQLADARALGSDLARVHELHRLRLLEIDARANDEQARAAEQAAEQAASARASLLSGLDRILLGDGSTLGFAEKITYARGRYETTLASARMGDAGALGNLTGIAEQYLGATRDAFASSSAYRDVFARVTGDIRALAGTTAGGVNDNRPVVDALVRGTAQTTDNFNRLIAALEAQIASLRDEVRRLGASGRAGGLAA